MDREDFLNITKQIESSGGKNLDHPTITDPDSMHFGQHAVGRYAIMPKTVEELGKSSHDASIRALSKMSNDDMNQYLKENPDLDEHLANTMADKLEKRFPGEPEKQTYAWQYGHNLPQDRVTDEVLNNNDRVNKFKSLASTMNKNNAVQEPLVPQSPLNLPAPGPTPQPVLPKETTPEPQASPIAQKVPVTPTKEQDFSSTDVFTNNDLTNNPLLNNQKKFQRLFQQRIKGT